MVYSMDELVRSAESAGIPTQAKDRKSTRLNSSHLVISYAVFCLKKKTPIIDHRVHVALRGADRIDRPGVASASPAAVRYLLAHRHGIAPGLLLQRTRIVRLPLSR